MLGGASLRIARVFNEIPQSLCSISGVLVNKKKSAVYGWNIDQQTIIRIYRFLGFSGFASWDKIKYLGLPLTLGSNRPSLQIEVISKIKSKVSTWGGQWLNTAGKLTLINQSYPLFLSTEIPSFWHQRQSRSRFRSCSETSCGMEAKKISVNFIQLVGKL